MQKFIISMLVSNQFGVLTRISAMFGRRGFNIDSLTVGVSEDPEFSRMTVTMTGDDYSRDQIVKQLAKLHDVKKIKVMDPAKAVSRELILVKVRSTKETRQDIMDAVNVFRNRIIDYSPDVMIIEIAGDANKIGAFIELMRPYGIIELSRTGIVSLDRGKENLKEQKK